MPSLFIPLLDFSPPPTLLARQVRLVRTVLKKIALNCLPKHKKKD